MTVMVNNVHPIDSISSTSFLIKNSGRWKMLSSVYDEQDVMLVMSRLLDV